MKIASVTIKNFRVFKEETIDFDNYTCLVGPNGVGKSTILTALNIFFRENSGSSTNLTSLTEQDFHDYDTTRPIEITVTFVELSAQAKADLRDYVRQDKLTPLVANRRGTRTWKDRDTGTSWQRHPHCLPEKVP